MKEEIKSIIWKCFECHLDGNDNFETYDSPGRDITLQFFNSEDYYERTGYTDTFAWGILMKNWEKDEYGFPIHKDKDGYYDGSPDKHMFAVYDYFDGTPSDLLKNGNLIVDKMTESIMDWISE